MAGFIEHQWSQSGSFRSNVLQHKLLGGDASSLTFSGLAFPAGYARLDERSITLVVVSGSPPWSPPEHAFPHGWSRRVTRSGSSFTVTFDVPSRTALSIAGNGGALSGLRVRARLYP
ncbi:MAG: hypothetical protein IT372_28815 [Polyangiaceae bacterium]|nr:hypothetical protein [Polyangiaceae bacterium]